MVAWIRVSAIQLECFGICALKKIGNLLSKLLKIDALTTAQHRGKFARLYVKLDLSKPLKAFVQINNEWYNIEYEGLLDICYLCGKYGHKRENCELKADVSAPNIGEGSTKGQNPTGPDAEMGQVDSVDTMEELRGPWMIVQPCRKSKVVVKYGGSKVSGGQSQGSRFEKLRQVRENFGDVEASGHGGDKQAIMPT
ncbi:hypothetical protein L3X38_004493 [Prunus dulcis]|uniref:CCHC-type domain-containing protein n=1 Tax=Prunus dulcis TaxID=3755 RepID=A0AAD5F377_PRUDU|nr:hypothetical protein L3X38_004493 [Prunus dulcis]